MKGRSEGYLTMTDENGEAYFLDDDASVALARSYLNAIKRNSDVEGAPKKSRKRSTTFTRSTSASSTLHTGN